MKFEVVGWLPYYLRDDFHEETDVNEAVIFALVNDIREHGYWLKEYDYEMEYEQGMYHGLALLSNGKYVWIDDDFAQKLLKQAYGEHLGVYSIVAGIADNIPSQVDYKKNKINIINVNPDAYDDLKRAVDNGVNVEFIPYYFYSPYVMDGDVVRFCSEDEDGNEVYFDAEIIQSCNTNYCFETTMSDAKKRHKSLDICDILAEFLSFEKPSFPLCYRYNGLDDEQFVDLIRNTYENVEDDIQAIIFKKTQINEGVFEIPQEVSIDNVLEKHRAKFIEALELKKKVADIADEIIAKAWQGDFSVSKKKVDKDLTVFKEMFERLFLKREWLDCEEVEQEFNKVSSRAYKIFESVMKDICALDIAYRFSDNEFFGMENYYYACNDRILPNPRAQTPENRELQKLILQMLEVDTPSSISEISMRLGVGFDNVKNALNELVRIGDARFSSGHYYATSEQDGARIAKRIPTLSELGYKVVNIKLANKKDKKD